MTTTTVEKKDHALLTAKAHLESIIELHKNYSNSEELRYRIEEEAQASVLSVEVSSSDWQPVGNEFKATEGRLLLSTGGPACHIIFELDEYGQPAGNTTIQHQDWGTPWISLEINDDERDALDWFTTLFFYGEY